MAPFTRLATSTAMRKRPTTDQKAGVRWPWSKNFAMKRLFTSCRPKRAEGSFFRTGKIASGSNFRPTWVTPESTKPMMAMKRPMPTEMPFFNEKGMASMNASRTFMALRAMKTRPSSNRAVRATWMV